MQVTGCASRDVLDSRQNVCGSINSLCHAHCPKSPGQEARVVDGNKGAASVRAGQDERRPSTGQPWACFPSKVPVSRVCLTLPCIEGHAEARGEGKRGHGELAYMA